MATQVFFKFLGSEEIPTHTISVGGESLQKHPDSLLTKLYDDKWKKGSEGSTFENPIVTAPLESLKAWLPSMAIMIETFYKTSEFVLPKHVELEEAIEILDFYGLPLEDPGKLKVEETDVATVIRGQLFLERSKNYKAAVEAIVEEFSMHPEVEKHFVFFSEKVSYREADKIRECISLPTRSLREGSHQWFQVPKFRTRMVADFEAFGFQIALEGENVFVGSGRGTEYLGFAHIKVPDPQPVETRQKLLF